MTTRYSAAVKNGVLSNVGIDTQLNLSKLYLFSGAVPATADEALNMAATHTELSEITNNDTDTGLTFGTAAAGVLPKTAAETWSGTNTFDGVNSATTPQAPTFYRLCAAGDNGRAAANASTGYRFQGTVGGPGSGADMVLGSATIVAGNVQAINDYYIEAL